MDAYDTHIRSTIEFGLQNNVCNIGDERGYGDGVDVHASLS
jgi:hypothetical protein